MISDAGPHPYFELIGAHTDRERFDVRLATVGPSGSLQTEAERMGLESFSLDARGRWDYPRTAIALARRLRRDRIDVLQAHLLDGAVVGLTAARLARTPVAILTGHHSHEIPLHGRRSLAAADRLCAGPLCDSIIAPSEQMQDTLVSVHRVRPEKVKVVHHGFELDRLDPERVDGARVRAELALDGRLVIGSIGRLYWIKNQESLVRAFATVAAGLPEAVLLLVGGGDPAPVLDLARTLDVEDRIVLIPRREDVPELLAAMDLFVHPALAESFGMVIVEAMAMARPVVSTPVGIAPVVVESGTTGVLAAGGRTDQLQLALSEALAVRADWPAMGAEARRRALEFPAARMVAQYEHHYERLLP